MQRDYFFNCFVSFSHLASDNLIPQNGSVRVDAGEEIKGNVTLKCCINTFLYAAQRDLDKDEISGHIIKICTKTEMSSSPLSGLRTSEKYKVMADGNLMASLTLEENIFHSRLVLKISYM